MKLWLSSSSSLIYGCSRKPQWILDAQFAIRFAHSTKARWWHRLLNEETSSSIDRRKFVHATNRIANFRWSISFRRFFNLVRIIGTQDVIISISILTIHKQSNTPQTDNDDKEIAKIEAKKNGKQNKQWTTKIEAFVKSERKDEKTRAKNVVSLCFHCFKLWITRVDVVRSFDDRHAIGQVYHRFCVKRCRQRSIRYGSRNSVFGFVWQLENDIQKKANWFMWIETNEWERKTSDEKYYRNWNWRKVHFAIHSVSLNWNSLARSTIFVFLFSRSSLYFIVLPTKSRHSNRTISNKSSNAISFSMILPCRRTNILSFKWNRKKTIAKNHRGFSFLFSIKISWNQKIKEKKNSNYRRWECMNDEFRVWKDFSSSFLFFISNSKQFHFVSNNVLFFSISIFEFICTQSQWWIGRRVVCSSWCVACVSARARALARLA